MLNLKHYTKVLKYIVSGGSAAIVNIGSFAIMKGYFGFWYLSSSIIAYTFAFFVSFTLQKFWTFDNQETSGIRGEIVSFLIYNLFGLCLNTLIVYILVDHLSVSGILAQLIAGVAVALCSFFAYRSIFTEIQR